MSPAAADLPYLILHPMLRVGRWVLLLAMAGALAFGSQRLGHPTLRSGLAVALGGYSLLSMALLRLRPLTPALVLGIISADFAYIALLVEGTGGMRSPFFGLYYLVVVAGAVFYQVAGGLAVAGAAVAVSALGEAIGLHGAGPPPVDAVMATVPYLLAAAVVAGYLTAQLKREMALHQEAQRAATRLQVQRESDEREMAVAHEVQQAALPRVPADLEGLEIGVRFRAAREVGGDFYDFYRHGAELGLLVGDAGGKGVPAALVATTAMHTFHSRAPEAGLEAWCREFNRELAERAPTSMLVTAVCCRLDGTTGKGVWINAGHPPPVLCRPGQPPGLLEKPGLVLGVASEVEYTGSELELAPGDVLVLYTDGLTEARCPDGSLFGIEPVLALLPDIVGLAADPIAAEIEAYVLQNTEPRDDLTILVVKKRTG